MPILSRVVCFLSFALALSACAPSLSPLYRDYEVRTPAPDSVSSAAPADADRHTLYARIRSALAEAGWAEVPADAPNVVSTAPRRISNWGLYRTELSIDVAPVGEDHVRVFFHPVRYTALGGRTSLGYLSSGLRRAVVPDLNTAFARHGLVVLGTPRERDEETVDG